jgi:hypothetical protein
MALPSPLIIRGPTQRSLLLDYAWRLPIDTVVSFKGLTRTLDQNARFWAMLGDVSKQEPLGRRYTADQWKVVFMNACGWECQFLETLEGTPFPVGFRSSKLTVRQMADLITFIQAWGDEYGIEWSEPPPEEPA